VIEKVNGLIVEEICDLKESISLMEMTTLPSKRRHSIRSRITSTFESL
jgi:hypothetical protein